MLVLPPFAPLPPPQKKKICWCHDLCLLISFYQRVCYSLLFLDTLYNIFKMVCYLITVTDCFIIEGTFMGYIPLQIHTPYESITLTSWNTTCWLVKDNTLSPIEPIRKGVRKNSLKCKFVIQQFISLILLANEYFTIVNWSEIILDGPAVHRMLKAHYLIQVKNKTYIFKLSVDPDFMFVSYAPFTVSYCCLMYEILHVNIRC